MPEILHSPGFVCRSTRPAEHRAIIETNVAEREKRVTAMLNIAEALVPGSSPYGHVNQSTSVQFSGIRVDRRADVEAVGGVPDGLRWDTKAGRGVHLLVPALRTERGKELGAQFKDLSFTPLSLGAVSEVRVMTDGKHSYFTTALIEVLGDEVYATWRFPLENEGNERRSSDRYQVTADPGWVEIPLSEFYAAREQHPYPDDNQGRGSAA